MNNLAQRLDDGFMLRINRHGQQMFLPDNSTIKLEGVANSILEIRSDDDGLSCDADLPEGPYTLALDYQDSRHQSVTQQCDDLAYDLEALVNDIRLGLNGRL